MRVFALYKSVTVWYNNIMTTTRTTQWDGVYDTEEVSVIQRMRRVLIEKYGWEPEDFEGMSFTDVEYEFLEVEEDFRPEDDLG